MADPAGRLSHLDESGAAHMVDVTGKDATKRTAVAAGTLHTTADVVALIASGGLPKGDALATARVAGILAAKRTSDLIPLCHQLALTGVDVDFEVGEATIGITATVRTHRPHRRRDGGADGGQRRRADALRHDQGRRPRRPHRRHPGAAQRGRQDGQMDAVMSAARRQRHDAIGRVVIASTRAAAGVYEDRTGPIIVDWLNQQGIDDAGACRGRRRLWRRRGAVRRDRRKRRRGNHFRRHRHLADGRARPTPPRTSSTIRSPAWPMRSGARACRMCRRRCCPAGCAASGPHADRQPSRLHRGRQRRSRRARRRARARARSTRGKDHPR